jgi:hypothetical protein
MKSKKALIFCLVAVLALSLMGFGFAKWTDELKVHGTVKTGDLDVSIHAFDTNDDGYGFYYGIDGYVQCDDGRDPQWGKGNNDEGKKVAHITFCPYSKGNDKELYLAIENAYPWYNPQFTFFIQGNGSVPAKIQNVTFDINEDNDGLSNFIKVIDWKIYVDNPKSHGLPKEYRTIKPGDKSWDGLCQALKGIQIHKDGKVWVKVNAGIEQNGCGDSICPENATLKGIIKFDFVQWNRYEEQV